MDKNLDPLLDLIHASKPSDLKPIFERHDVREFSGVAALSREIRLDGGNTFANIFRGGEGVSYEEIVRDVAKRLGVDAERLKGLREMESAALKIAAEKWWDKLSEEERCSASGDLGISPSEFSPDKMKLVLKAGPLFLGLGGYFLKRGAVVAVSRVGLARAAAFLNPAFMVAGFGLLANDMAAPAFRKTTTTVLQLAWLRAVHETPEGAGVVL